MTNAVQNAADTQLTGIIEREKSKGENSEGERAREKERDREQDREREKERQRQTTGLARSSQGNHCYHVGHDRGPPLEKSKIRKAVSKN